MEKINAEDAFETIYYRLCSLDSLASSCYSEEAEIVRKALESLNKLKESVKVIASM